MPTVYDAATQRAISPSPAISSGPVRYRAATARQHRNAGWLNSVS